MSSLKTCIYPRLEALTSKELSKYFTPTPAEIEFCKLHVKQPIRQTYFLVILKSLSYLNYLPRCQEIPYKALRQVNLAISHTTPSKQAFAQYDGSGSHGRHVKLIREYLNLKPAKGKAESLSYQWALDLAKSKTEIADIINGMIEYLIHNKFELPELAVLERTAAKARANVNEQLFNQINAYLNPSQRKRIDALYSSDTNKTGWHRVKTSPAKPTQNNIKDYLVYLSWLKSLAAPFDFTIDIPSAKIDQYIHEARALDASEMRRLKHNKRYALSVILIKAQLAQTLDNVTNIFIKLLQEIERTGNRLLDQYYLDKKGQSDWLLKHFKNILTSFQDAHDSQQKLKIVHEQIDPNIEAWLQGSDQHLSAAKRKNIPFMLSIFKSKRSLIFTCLENLMIDSCFKDPSLIRCWDFIKELKNRKSQYLPLYEKNGQRKTIPLHWVPSSWHDLIPPTNESMNNITKVHKTYFELCLFLQIKRELKSGELYVRDSEDYADISNRFIDDETLRDELSDYGALVDLPTNGKEFVKLLRSEMKSLCVDINKTEQHNR